jgi:hypothetical protein
MAKKKSVYLFLIGLCVIPLIILGIWSTFVSCDLGHNSDNSAITQPNECIANHIIESHPEILQSFAQKGWDTSRSNWLNIVSAWSKLDPAGYAKAIKDIPADCLPPDTPCFPQNGYLFNVSLINYYATQLNDNTAWYNYCSAGKCNRWNPLSKDALPCMTFVSTVWYLAGVKEMDAAASPYDGFCWYITPDSSGLSWQNGDEFYDYTATYYPELVTGDVGNIPDIGLCSKDGLTVRNGLGVFGDPFIDGVVGQVNQNVKVGDVFQYYGLYGDRHYYKHSVIVVEARPDDPAFTAKIASFGWNQSPRMDWTAMTFDFTRVRKIKLPQGGTTPLLRKNPVKNPSFETREYNKENWLVSVANDPGSHIINEYVYALTESNGDPKAQFGYNYLYFYQPGTYSVRQTVTLQSGKFGLKAFVKSSDGINYCSLITPGAQGLPHDNVPPAYLNWDVIERDFQVSESGSYDIELDMSVPEGTQFYVDDVQVVNQ